MYLFCNKLCPHILNLCRIGEWFLTFRKHLKSHYFICVGLRIKMANKNCQIFLKKDFQAHLRCAFQDLILTIIPHFLSLTCTHAHAGVPKLCLAPHFDQVFIWGYSNGKYAVRIQQVVELHGFHSHGWGDNSGMKHNLGGLVNIMHVLTVIMHFGR